MSVTKGCFVSLIPCVLGYHLKKNNNLRNTCPCTHMLKYSGTDKMNYLFGEFPKSSQSKALKQ